MDMGGPNKSLRLRKPNGWQYCDILTKGGLTRGDVFRSILMDSSRRRPCEDWHNLF
jgi:hypothetical protein